MPKSLNFIYAFKCYPQIAINVGLSWPHFSWPTLYTHYNCSKAGRVLKRKCLQQLHRKP